MPSKLSAAVLAACLAATPALAFDVNDMTDAERDAFGAEVRNYLMTNPQVIMDAVAALETQKAEAQAAADETLIAALAADLFDDGYSWVGGNPEGDITLVEFIDYRCGYCRRAHDDVEELITTDGNIRFVVKEFPILGADSLASARFAIATRMIAGDEAYKAAHDALITLNAEASEPVLRRLAATLGVDADAVIAKMEDPEVTRIIADTRALAQQLNINGTPSFVMGDEMVRGYVPLDTMRQIVAAERAEG